MIDKRPLVADRVRRPPRQGWSWIDRRFLREYAATLSHDAIVLYFFLAAVSDRHGMSYYSDAGIAARLHTCAAAVAQAREQLLARDLVAYRDPLTQVLALPDTAVRRGGLGTIGDLFRALAGEPPSATTRPGCAGPRP